MLEYHFVVAIEGTSHHLSFTFVLVELLGIEPSWSQ